MTNKEKLFANERDLALRLLELDLDQDCYYFGSKPFSTGDVEIAIDYVINWLNSEVE